MKIAIFGGSFDPPHKGHISIVKTALQVLDIDKLIVVPAYLNPFKTSSHATPAKRLEWLTRVFDGYKNVEVSDFEILQNRPVPSIETVMHFKQPSDEIYLIIGADNLSALKKWHRFEELDSLVTWAVATRDDIAVPEGYIQLPVSEAVSSTLLREKVEPSFLPAEIAQDIVKHYKENNGTTH